MLDKMHIYGWEEIEPLILVSLVTRRPLLLIGECGTNKTEGVKRIAESLNLSFHRYDASKTVFEDVIGFPDLKSLSKGVANYIPTPLTIWNKAFVLVDEINRAGMNMQNKWFEVINEKTCMGNPTKIKFVWSAINPNTSSYMGTNELDKALADRFALFVKVPDVFHMKEEEVKRIIGDGDVYEEYPDLIKIVQEIEEQVTHYTFKDIGSFLVTWSRILKNEHGIYTSGRRLIAIKEAMKVGAVIDKIFPGMGALEKVLTNCIFKIDKGLLKKVFDMLKPTLDGIIDKESEGTIKYLKGDALERLIQALETEDHQLKHIAVTDVLGKFPSDTVEGYVVRRLLLANDDEGIAQMIHRDFVIPDDADKVKAVARDIKKRLGEKYESP